MLQLTLDELIKKQKEELTRLLDQAGGCTHLAKMLNLSQSTVMGWEKRGRISKKGALRVGEHMALCEQFDARELRPDL